MYTFAFPSTVKNRLRYWKNISNLQTEPRPNPSQKVTCKHLCGKKPAQRIRWRLNPRWDEKTADPYLDFSNIPLRDYITEGSELNSVRRDLVCGCFLGSRRRDELHIHERSAKRSFSSSPLALFRGSEPRAPSSRRAVGCTPGYQMEASSPSLLDKAP